MATFSEDFINFLNVPEPKKPSDNVVSGTISMVHHLGEAVRKVPPFNLPMFTRPSPDFDAECYPRLSNGGTIQDPQSSGHPHFGAAAADHYTRRQPNETRQGVPCPTCYVGLTKPVR